MKYTFRPKQGKLISGSIYIKKYLRPKVLIQKCVNTFWGKVLLFAWISKSLIFYFYLLRKLWILNFVLIISATSVFAQGESPLEIANYWYGRRAEGHSGLFVSSNSIDKAIDWYGIALDKDPQSSKAAIGLMASYYFKATFVAMPKSELKTLSEDAQLIADEFANKYSNSGPVLYWSATLWALWVEQHNILLAAQDGVALKIKNLAESVIELAPEYRSKGGFRLLGLTHFNSPRIPFILPWPSNEVSKTCLEKAALENPEHLGNLLALARLYHKLDKNQKSIQLLQKIIASDPREELVLEDKQIISIAHKLLGDTKSTTIY